MAQNDRPFDTGNTQPKYARASAANPAIAAEAITQLEDSRRTIRTGGRPKQLAAMPKMDGMSPQEEVLFDEFITEYLDQFPDLLPSDYRVLFLAATAYIKLLRVTNAELKSGTVLAMSRQHPGVEMRALLDQLSVTRRARAKVPAQEPESDKLRDFFLELSGKPR